MVGIISECDAIVLAKITNHLLLRSLPQNGYALNVYDSHICGPTQTLQEIDTSVGLKRTFNPIIFIGAIIK